MGQALYRKYRSKSLSELVGQDHIVKALSASIKSGKISHAYLLTGPRGTGKTSVARILAHELNGIPYDETVTNLDIIEIDAASNRRIDEIRDLREKVHIAPSILKYKVYIIDEVHMLTREAFNALLKTLEEPPEHVIFVLATTELAKVPDTIISRTQRYSFKPIEQFKMVEHLKEIAKGEHIDFDEEALSVIAEHADGGFRDAIGLLDQVRHTNNKVTVESVAEALGSPPNKLIEQLWVALGAQDPRASMFLQNLYTDGYHAPQIAKSLLSLAVESGNIALARKLLGVQSSFDPKTELLLAVLEMSRESQSNLVPAAFVDSALKLKAEKHPKPLLDSTNTNDKPSTKSIDTTDKTGLPSKTTQNGVWEEILEKVKAGGHSVYGPLRLAESTIESGVLKLGLAFPFHIKRINEQKNLETLHNATKEVTGKDYKIVVERVQRGEGASETIAKSVSSPTIQSIANDPDAVLMSDPLSIVKNVFGGAEVL